MKPEVHSPLGMRPRVKFAVFFLCLPVMTLCCGKDKTSAPVGPRPVETILVPAGSFVMGSPDDEPGRSANETQHEVTLTDSLLVQSTEVTQAEWREVMGWNDSQWTGDGLPVENVTWFDAVDFCNRLSRSESLTPAYSELDVTARVGAHITEVEGEITWDRSTDGYRLLTEAEWEYACRSESLTAYPGGPIVDGEGSCRREPGLEALGWYCYNSGMKTHAAGSKSPNAWGFHDMNGNVWEWCWDRGDTTYAAAVTDPLGAVNRPNRALRGGSWGTTTVSTRSATRNWLSPESHFNYVGLRVARTRHS